MSAKFEKAVSIVNSLPSDGPIQTNNDQKLKFYSLYKQASVGDCDTTRPGFMDFTGKAKWSVYSTFRSIICSDRLIDRDAWNARKGTSKETAQEEYVELLKDILNTNGSPESEKHIKEIDAA
ncbi:hypothetical protein FRB95_010671 [Tulasnella sp. JGI-2019a]|nr:hypothetical protein FRB95_010671 [Tulasnella sp. JGI-2019a]